MSGCLLVIFAIGAWLGVTALLGFVASWLLLQFGYHVTWFVCAVAIWLVSAIIRGGTYTINAVK